MTFVRVMVAAPYVLAMGWIIYGYARLGLDAPPAAIFSVIVTVLHSLVQCEVMRSCRR